MLRYGVYCVNLVFFLILLFSAKVVLANVDALQQGVHWTSKPILLTKRIKNANRRAETGIKAVNIKPQKVLAYPSSKAESSPSELKASDDSIFKVKAQKTGNYHWLVAIDHDNKNYAATTKYFSRPGPAPRSMLKQHKLPLEIRPVDLPREHRRFRALESWPFQVFYQAKPLVNSTVLLETSKGSKEQYQTNQQGIIEMVLPNDFKNENQAEKQHQGHQQHGQHDQGNPQTEKKQGVKKQGVKKQDPKKQSHHRRRQSAHFVLSVQHEGHTSAFNYKYSPEPFQKKSILIAVGLLFIGMIVTWFVLYRRKSV